MLNIAILLQIQTTVSLEWLIGTVAAEEFITNNYRN